MFNTAFRFDATPKPYGPIKILKKGVFPGYLNKSLEFGGIGGIRLECDHQTLTFGFMQFPFFFFPFLNPTSTKLGSMSEKKANARWQEKKEILLNAWDNIEKWKLGNNRRNVVPEVVHDVVGRGVMTSVGFLQRSLH